MPATNFPLTLSEGPIPDEKPRLDVSAVELLKSLVRSSPAAVECPPAYGDARNAATSFRRSGAAIRVSFGAQRRRWRGSRRRMQGKRAAAVELFVDAGADDGE